MILKKFFLLLLIFITLFFYSCTDEKPPLSEVVIYSGITMVKPITEIANIILEKNENLKITIIEGPAKNLYQTIKESKIGDLFLPCYLSFKQDNIADSILIGGVVVGSNRLVFFVQEGNPKNITPDIINLTNKEYSVIIGNHESSSVGEKTRMVLERNNIVDEVLANSQLFAIDSKSMNRLMRKNNIDLALNWASTINYRNNNEFLDVIELPESTTYSFEITMELLKFSQNRECAKKIMDFAISKEGEEIFRKYGFL